MAEAPLIDLSSGAGDHQPHGHANFVVIDTPTPKPVEEVPQQVISTLIPPPVASQPISLAVSQGPVRSLSLKPTKWAMGLIGPLREATFVGEKKSAKLIVNFTSGLFSDSTAIVTDPLNNNMQPFEIVDASSVFSGEKITIYARNEQQKIAIGKIEECGCKCQGLRRITIGQDIYWIKYFMGAVGYGTSLQARFTTIFSERGLPLIHWSDNSCNVDIYTHSDVTLLLMILAYETQSRYNLSFQRIVCETLPELDAYTRYIQHPNHMSWIVKYKHHERHAGHICAKGVGIRFDFGFAPPLFGNALMPGVL